MTSDDHSIPEEIVGLSFHFLPPERQAQVDEALRALQQDPRLEFMLAVLTVTLHDRPLAPATAPSPGLLSKLLQALEESEGAVMLYSSPYNELGSREFAPRLDWWNFDLGESLYRFPDLHSIRAFLEHGTGNGRGRGPAEAQRLHDLLLRGLIGDSTNFAVWSCSNVRTPGGSDPTADGDTGVWPADDVSPWFHGVFWDDLLFILNPQESTLSILAITSR
jgi:hypothetical protein